MRTRPFAARALTLAALAVLVAGCGLLLGFGDEATLADPDGGWAREGGGGDGASLDGAVAAEGGSSNDGAADGGAGIDGATAGDGAFPVAPLGGGRVMYRAKPEAGTDVGSIYLASLDDGGVFDLGAQLTARYPDEADASGEIRYGMRLASMSPNGEWLVVAVDRWPVTSPGSLKEPTYLIHLTDWTREALVAGTRQVEEAAIVDDTGTLLVFESKAIEGGRDGRWLYKSTRANVGAPWSAPELITEWAAAEPWTGHFVGTFSADRTKVLSSCDFDKFHDDAQLRAICETTLATHAVVSRVTYEDLNDAGTAMLLGPSYLADGTILFAATNAPVTDNGWRLWRVVGGKPTPVTPPGLHDDKACGLPAGGAAAVTQQPTELSGRDGVRLYGWRDGGVRDLPGIGRRIDERGLYCTR